MLKILVADDEPLTNQIVSETLRKWGYEVISTNNGLDAWKALQSNDPPKLAILDWMMPGMTGVEICHHLRSQKTGSYVYAMLLTSKSDKVDIVEGLAAGADDYLTKPCNPQELRVRLNVGERILRLEKDLLEALKQLKQSATADSESLNKLNARELEILQLVASQKSNEDIAKTFQLSPNWVDAHLNNIFQKLHVTTREQAAQKAKDAGLLSQPQVPSS